MISNEWLWGFALSFALWCWANKILTPPTSINFSSCKICSLGDMCSVLVVVLSFIQNVWCGQAWGEWAHTCPLWWEWDPWVCLCGQAMCPDGCKLASVYRRVCPVEVWSSRREALSGFRRKTDGQSAPSFHSSLTLVHRIFRIPCVEKISSTAQSP